MGATHSVRRLSVECIALLEQLEPNEREQQHKREVRDLLQHALAQEWPACRVVAFGSSESDLGFGGSDVDVGIYFDDMLLDAQRLLNVHERIQILQIAQARLAGTFDVTAFIQHARVPVLKLWDPVRQIACDVCVGGVHALLNTALLKYYNRYDPRVRPLVFAVKYWAQQRGINDSVNGTLSSYGYALLVLFYLQTRDVSPILLPAIHTQLDALQHEQTLAALLEHLDAVVRTTAGPSTATFGTLSTDSVGALLTGFFHYYTRQFKWETDVVSVRVGTILSKQTTSRAPVAWRLSIEDPFERSHDVGRVLFASQAQALLQTEFERAAAAFDAGATLCDVCAVDATAWFANNVSCYICSSSDHKARTCPTLQQILRVEQLLASGTECWYCGACGHVKAACPMLVFRHIPLPIDAVGGGGACMGVVTTPAQPMRRRRVGGAATITATTTTSIVTKRLLSSAPSVGEWTRGFSPLPVLSLAPIKKKKRPRQGSFALSPVLSMRGVVATQLLPSPLVSPSLLPEKRVRRKHHKSMYRPQSLLFAQQQQQRWQQQRWQQQQQKHVVRVCGSSEDVAMTSRSTTDESTLVNLRVDARAS